MKNVFFCFSSAVTLYQKLQKISVLYVLGRKVLVIREAYSIVLFQISCAKVVISLTIMVLEENPSMEISLKTKTSH